MLRLLPVTLFLVACGGGLELPESSTAPVSAPADAVYYEGVTYGEEQPERQAFDLAHFPDAAEPTPLVIYVHGGGFTGGDKEAAWTGRAAFTEALIAEEIAVASCGYRLLDEVDTEGVIKPLTDSARCLQTLRHHAEQLNLDPDNVVVAGTSAGAGTALWLGTHDDLSDGSNAVSGASTRIQGVIAWETQATYDLVRWDDVYLSRFGLELFTTAEQFGLSQALWSFYGISSNEELQDPDIVAYRQDVDMLGLMDSGDAAFWVENAVEGKGFPLGVGALYHHPLHALALVERANEVGLRVEARIPKLDPEEQPPETSQSAVDFALEMLGR